MYSTFCRFQSSAYLRISDSFILPEGIVLLIFHPFLFFVEQHHRVLVGQHHSLRGTKQLFPIRYATYLKVKSVDKPVLKLDIQPLETDDQARFEEIRPIPLNKVDHGDLFETCLTALCEVC
jgi:hypothetical protein